MATESESVLRPVEVLLISRVKLYSSALAELLQGEAAIASVCLAEPQDDILARFDAVTPDTVLLDCGSSGAFALVSDLVRQRPAARVLGFGVDDVPAEVAACAAAGLSGYVPSSASAADLAIAAQQVGLGETVCSATMARGLFRHLREISLGRFATPSDAELTARQRQIVRLIGEGLSNKEIARRLNLGASTVKNHVHEILGRLQVTSRAAAAAHVRRNAPIL